MYRVAVFFLFWLLLAAAACSQQDLCAGYQDSPKAPHKGPRKFNVIHIAYSAADSSVLVIDPQGHRFGMEGHGKTPVREISRAFYEDDNTAQSDTGLPATRQPREITIHYAQSGRYRIVFTDKNKDLEHWLKVRTSTCGKRWQKQISLPSRNTALSTVTLIYDSHAAAEPQLYAGEHAGDTNQ